MVPQPFPLYATNPGVLQGVYLVVGWADTANGAVALLVRLEESHGQDTLMPGAEIPGGLTYWTDLEAAKDHVENHRAARVSGAPGLYPRHPDDAGDRKPKGWR